MAIPVHLEFLENQIVLNKKEGIPMAVEVSVSTTPNENAMKYTLNCNSVESGHKTNANVEAAEESPDAQIVAVATGSKSIQVFH